ncbi:MAG: DUF106 domain-containing protein [Nanoarchaeota archaeon]|nr:DUF106 domain-containing protein [Nanoarchaeota archaeon]
MAISLLDKALGPLLVINPLISIIIVAFAISLLITVAYKYLTNQSLMKDMKEEQKELQNKIKELKNHPEKAMKIQNKMMEVNMKYMSHSMRPTLFTFIPIIIIFGWLNSHMGYYPLYPGTPFEATVTAARGIAGDITLILPEELSFVNTPKTQEIVNGKVTWIVKGSAGEHDLNFTNHDLTYSKKILITEERSYYPPEEKIKKSFITTIQIGNEKVKPLEGVPLVGNWGWLGVYILFSVVFSMGIRKVLNIY